MSDEPVRTAAVDLDLLAEHLRSALLSEAGLVRLEPTIRSTVRRFGLMPVAAFAKGGTGAGRSASSVTDGLTLSLAGSTISAQIDVATDVSHSALALSERLQTVTAGIIEHHGFTAGTIDVTILAIEETDDPAPPAPPGR